MDLMVCDAVEKIDAQAEAKLVDAREKIKMQNAEVRILH